MDWWRVIVTNPMDYVTLSTREGQTGPWAPSYFVEVPQYRTWDAWCAGLRARFEPIAASIAARQKLRTWRQLGSVQDYTSGFLALCEQVGYMHESERIDRYISGLKHDIAQEIQLRGVTDFQEILAMAEKLDFFRRPRPGSYGNGGASHSLINIATARKLRLTLDRCLPEIDARLEMLATTLDGTDILLSRDWLRRHNPRIDWTTGDCTVRVNGNNITLPRWGSPESSSVRVNAITMKRAVAAGADMYAVDIREAEAADKGGDLQKLLADVPDDSAALLKQYSGIFPDDLPTGLPPQQTHDHRIELEPEAQPTVQRLFRLTQPELDELRKQLHYLLEKEFIRPSSSPFAAPILFTPKKDGGFRMCIDYRALNRVTIKSRYPIPRADELIDQLRTAQIFSKIDLRGGYHQIRVNPPNFLKTAFQTRYGSFEYTVMPFGLTNAPASFQMTMNEAFRLLLDKCVIVYLDDILVYSPDLAQHLQDIEAAFKILSENRLLTKASKCEFLQD
ncbi:unnamed protein product [Closterium sp. NIES-53]